MRFSRIQRILTRRTTVDLCRPCRAAPGVQVTFARIWIRQRSRDATLFTTPEKNGIDAAEAFTSPLKTGQLLKFKNILLRNQESGCQYLRLSPFFAREETPPFGGRAGVERQNASVLSLFSPKSARCDVLSLLNEKLFKDQIVIPNHFHTSPAHIAGASHA